MSAQMYGADVAELERLAEQFRRTAEDLESEGNLLTNILGRLSWLGDVASDYIGEWTGVQIPRIGLSVEFLRQAARELQQQADEQFNASSVNARAGGVLPAGLMNQLREAERLSPAEQRRWWAELTNEQREQVLRNEPVKLLGLDGLPDDVKEAALAQYRADIADEVVTTHREFSVGAAGSLKALRLSKEVDVEMTTYADGSVTVSVERQIGIGAGDSHANGMVEFSGKPTYRFNSESEASLFLAGLAAASAVAVGPMSGPTIDAYLTSQRKHLESLGGGLDRSGSLSGKGRVEGKLGAGVSAELNTRTGDIEIEANYYGEGSITAGLLGVELPGSGGGTGLPPAVPIAGADLGVEVSASVLVRDGQPAELRFSMEVEGRLAEGVKGEVEATKGANARAHVDVTFDLNDPATAALGREAVELVRSGNPKEAARLLSTAHDRAEVRVQGFVGRDLKGSVDLKVVEVGASVSEEVAVVTVVKPPGASYIRM